jgi:TRAP-type C4-dicarboxylate transport system permease small subunit
MSLGRAYDGLITALAGLAAGLIGAVFLVVVSEVTIREAGLEPPTWTGSFNEYAMLYVTMLSAPYLVRTRGHVMVETLTQQLPDRERRWVEFAVCIACIAIASVLAVYGARLGLESIARAELDIRSAAAPKWILFAPLPPCFALIAVEFGRILVRGESLAASSDSLKKDSL